MDLAQVRQGFITKGIPAPLVDDVLDAYVEAKRRFHIGDHRPQAVEGGRFSEAVFRLLQHAAGLTVTPVGKTLPTVDSLLLQLQSSSSKLDSVRLHIPRTLRLIYDIRNKRNAAHLADGIDPNIQDATLVIGNVDWVLAELVRIYHGVSPNEAQETIADLVKKEVPAIQEIEGQPVILTDMQPRDRAVLMLYRAGTRGASLDELARWLRTPRKADLKKRLGTLDRDKLVLLHPNTKLYYITDKGVRYVDEHRLALPV